VFERFDDRARQAVVRAQDEARALHHGYLGTEHLLLGVGGEEEGPAARILARLGFDVAAARSAVISLIGRGSGGPGSESDTDALRAIGIDLEEVRRRVEEAFGPGALDHSPARRRRRFRRRCEYAPWTGHLPFTPRAKKSLELSLREAVHLGHNSIGTEHLLLGLLRVREGVACSLLQAQGIDYEQARRAIVDELRGGQGMSPPAPGA
jgi:ATP-dependent Clp protease ATP-binding subunit ClpA